MRLGQRRQNRQRGIMSQRPVLGIIACNRTVGTEVAQTVINRYATAAMRHADCAALIIPSLPEYMRASEIVGRLDGVLLTGTPSNVERSEEHTSELQSLMRLPYAVFC